MSSDLLALLAAVALLAANAFFVGAEFALVSARRDRLEALAHSGVGGAAVVIECPVTLLSTSPERDDTISMKDPFED